MNAGDPRIAPDWPAVAADLRHALSAIRHGGLVARRDPCGYTRAERLQLQRRRAGLTQVEAALLIGEPAHRWKQWETGERTRDLPDVPAPGDVRPREWGYIQRRRVGLLIRELAEQANLPAKWIHRAERGIVKNCAPLVEWWRQHPQPYPEP